ncbi:septal ring lytic transglycosylase RlpA family protein [Oceanibacterium hippocampi]|uniref:Endolytic peptidoglycan transglycosylase RlpA n=1 Tax=Oceanibacterium hippocampi TaxID=745714 RepID=A0A1Y5T8R8_9PROT|nr:septal ring lytic transglycosylase RlpA family protein [Oceanibacterium hippocampi]SLN54850.1 RlpA-like protein precursor [Oceanibacterium hippocampi]
MYFDRFGSVAVAASFVLLLGGCAEFQLATHAAKNVFDDGEATASAPSGGQYKVGKPYQINGVWYYPKVDASYDETGIASWYGDDFHGLRTANGDSFDMNALTAAHKTLPMPTKVRVTNLENGRSLVVTVNDRGPFVAGRIIDVSRRTAQLLDFERQGTARVRVQLVRDGGDGGTVIAKPVTPEVERKAVAAAPRIDVASETLAPPSGVTTAPSTPVRRLPEPAAEQQVASIEATPPQGRATVAEQVTVMPIHPTALYVQAGAFSDYQNAERLRIRLGGFGRTEVTHVLIDDVDFYRVRIGPVASVDAADGLLVRVIGAGYPSARIVVD